MLHSLQNQHSPARSAWSANAVVQAVFLAGIAVAITGCGASKKTTLTKEWQTEVGNKARTVAVEPQRGHLLVGQNKNTTVMDATGSVVYGQEEEEGGLSGFISEAKDAATSVDAETEGPLGAEEANQLDYVVVSNPGLALAFDYTADDDIIPAIDLGSGELTGSRPTTGGAWKSTVQPDRKLQRRSQSEPGRMQDRRRRN